MKTDDLTTHTGTIRRKSWSKSAESYAAGGGDYHVLETAGGNLILRPSERVTAAQLDALDGKRAEIRGREVAGREVPVDPTSQHIVEPSFPGGPAAAPPTRREGAGFEVHEARALDGAA